MFKKPHYRTVFVSDLHLGNKDCKADFLLEFLESCTIDTLYLVGDIVDLWAMNRQFRWPAKHNAIMHYIFELSKSQTKVIYLPGNHDAPLQKYSGMDFAEVEIRREVVYESLKGKRYLVLHGDQFDGEVTLGKFEAWVGDVGYDFLLFLNRWFNRAREYFNQEYWSLAGYIKTKIKGANEAIHRYRLACCKRACEMGLDGVICGHIHHPETCMVDAIEYINDGDWLENCTALVEDPEGNLRIVHYLEERQNAEVYAIDRHDKKTESAQAA